MIGDKIITKDAAYKMWLEDNFEDVLPFEDVYLGNDYLNYLKNLGFIVVDDRHDQLTNEIVL